MNFNQFSLVVLTIAMFMLGYIAGVSSTVTEYNVDEYTTGYHAAMEQVYGNSNDCTFEK